MHETRLGLPARPCYDVAMVAPSPSTSQYIHPDSARLAAWKRVYDNWRVVDDVFPELARRLFDAGVTRFAEIGGGHGPIAELLADRGVATCVVDRDPEMLADAHRPVVQGELRRLPLADGSCDGVAAINCLYFLEDPVVAITEAERVLRPGGLFVASSPSRWNDPELQGIDPNWGTASSFDAEDGRAIVARVFADVAVDWWRVVAYRLPDTQAIADYLHAFNVEGWHAKAGTLRPPLTITKIGCEIWACK
jgi:SAM-dependent methyltransferase